MASNHTRPRKKGGALKILLVLLVLMLAAAGGAFLLAKREIDGGTRQDAVTVEIAQGSGVSTIARASSGVRSWSAGTSAAKTRRRSSSMANFRWNPAAPTMRSSRRFLNMPKRRASA